MIAVHACVMWSMNHADPCSTNHITYISSAFQSEVPNNQHYHDFPSLVCTPRFPLACPWDVINCTCRVNGSRGYTQWIIQGINRSLCEENSNIISLSQKSNKCRQQNGTCGDVLYAENELPSSGSNGSCQTSILQITQDPALNGLQVVCHDTSYGGLNSTPYHVQLTG